MNKKYILVLESKTFYDGHGCGDDGGSQFSLEHTSNYNDLDLSLYYDYEMNPIEDDLDKEKYAEDGYNYEENTFKYKELTEEEYLKYQKLLEDYSNLYNVVYDK